MNLCLHEFEVKGILDGTITEIWRPVKPQPRETSEWLDVDPKCNFDWNSCYCGIDYIKSKSPFGSVGTRITGKETWGLNKEGGVEYKEDSINGVFLHCTSGGPDIDGTCQEYWNECIDWKSSVIMPSWASRITLITLDVICKLARDITEEEAGAAGFIKERHIFPDIDFRKRWNFLYSREGYPFESAWSWKSKFEAEVKR